MTDLYHAGTLISNTYFTAQNLYLDDWFFHGVWSFILKDLESLQNIFQQEAFTTCK